MALLTLASNSIERAIGPIALPPFDAAHIQNICYNLLWFYLGLKGRDQWIRFVSKSHWTKLVIAVFGYTLAFPLAQHLNMGAGAQFFCTILALTASSQALGLINTDLTINRLIAFIGKNTLPVYVMNTIILTAMTFVIKYFHLYDDYNFFSLPLQLGIPIATCVVVTLLCIALAKLLSRTPLKFAFEPAPSPFKGECSK